MVEQAAPLLWVGAAAIACVLAVRRPPARAALPGAAAGGSTFAAVTAFLGASPFAQVAVLAVVTGALVLVFAHWRRLLGDDRLPPGVGGNRLVGMVGEVLVPLEPDSATGRVLVGRETWRASATDGRAVPRGTVVEVIEVRGTRILVDVTDHAGPTPDRAPDRAPDPTPDPTMGSGPHDPPPPSSSASNPGAS